MLTGLYQGSAAMSSLERWQDAISQNIASSEVAGYKALGTSMHTQKMPMAEAGDNFSASLGSELVKADLSVNRDKGLCVQSGNNMDCAIDGDGYFQIRAEDGGAKYTRNGHFHVNNENVLVNANGEPVEGVSGTITLSPGGGDLSFDQNGRVYQGEIQIDQLKVVSADNENYLVPVTGGFVPAEGTDPGINDIAQPRILQGFYEASNVSPMREMVNMINVERAYEANQKVIQNADTTLGNAIQAFGTST
jgi:flagellar basal body rod protein FlgG